MTANDALERLLAGNKRYREGDMTACSISTDHIESLAGGQAPFAIILGCADSRVPAELVFDQSVGDLFVIRVAGNIAARSQIGSVEYAAEHCGSRLIVVLGHTGCGAVSATVGAMENPSAGASPNLALIVQHIQPTIEKLQQTEPGKTRETLLKHAVRANVRAVADVLRRDSAILSNLIETDGLKVVGAEYNLQTGEVDFFDGV
jgi:carbonic anhydrase